MKYKNHNEYYAVLATYVKLRKCYDVLTERLAKLSESFIEHEYSEMQDALIDKWLNDDISAEKFTHLFNDEQLLKSKAIDFLNEQLLPYVEKSIDNEEEQ